MIATRHKKGGNPGFWIGFERLQPNAEEILAKIKAHKAEENTNRFLIPSDRVEGDQIDDKVMLHQGLDEKLPDIFIIEGKHIRRH